MKEHGEGEEEEGVGGGRGKYGGKVKISSSAKTGKNKLKLKTQAQITFSSYTWLLFVGPPIWTIFNQKTRLYTPLCRFVCPSVGPSIGASIGPSVTLYFFFFSLWPHCSFLNDQVTSNTTPAHPHATGVAVYSALFYEKQICRNMKTLKCSEIKNLLRT